MGYYISQRDCSFKIKSENKTKALEVLNQFEIDVDNNLPKHHNTLEEKLEEWFGEVITAEKEAEKIEGELSDTDFDWKRKNPDDDEIDIVAILWGGDKYYGLLDDFLQALAPFVEKGSWIEMQGEEGEIWRWYFDGETLQTIEARIVFDMPTGIEGSLVG